MKGAIVGYGAEEHVGAHLMSAARSLGLEFDLVDAAEAFQGPRWLQRGLWLFDRRPVALRAFSEKLANDVRRQPVDVVVTTGIAPVDADAMRCLRDAGVRMINFLTDDPWNPVHRAHWFEKALPAYDAVYSPRHAIIDDLRRAGCRNVRYLPFGYNPEVHFPEPVVEKREMERLKSDVVFAGGADQDRVASVEMLIKAGIDVALYGGYWARHPSTRRFSRGIADMSTVRRAVAASRVALCVVRRANRDAHAMRTFELPAMGACMVVEHTPDHEALFGADGDAVLYFRTETEMVQRILRLLERPEERMALSMSAHRLITSAPHTYADRLTTMLELAT